MAYQQCLEAILGHPAQAAVLFQTVLQKNNAIGQTACVQIVEQPVALGGKGLCLQVIIADGPLAEEAQCPDLVGDLREAHDICPSAFQEGGEYPPVETYKARQRTNIDIPA